MAKRKIDSSTKPTKKARSQPSLRDLVVEEYHCTADQLQHLRKFVTPTDLSLEEMKLLFHELSVDIIGTLSDGGKGYHLLFLSQASHCMAWLREFLTCIGWSKNVTDFSPIHEAQTTEELREHTLKVAKLALQQRIQLGEASM